MLAIWSLVLLPFLNPIWTSGSSWLLYYWNLSWRILSITLLTREMNATVWVVWTFFGITFLWDWNENWLFQSCGHCRVFQICWHIEYSTLTASSFRVWREGFGYLKALKETRFPGLFCSHGHLIQFISTQQWFIKHISGESFTHWVVSNSLRPHGL